MKNLILLTSTFSIFTFSSAQNDFALRQVLTDIKKHPSEYMIPPECGFALSKVNLSTPTFDQAMTDTRFVSHFTTDSTFRADTTETAVEVYSAGGEVMAIETVQEYHPPSWVKDIHFEIPKKRLIPGRTVKDFQSSENCATQIHTGPIYQFKESSFVYLEYAYGENNDGSCDGVAWIIEVNNSSGRIEATHIRYLHDFECY